MSAHTLLMARDFGDAETTCNFHWIKRRISPCSCGGANVRVISDARFTAFLADLIKQEGFPKPLPHPRHGGGIQRGVAPRSVWIRVGVIEWLMDYLPPAAAARLDAQGQAAAADEMDNAAAALQLVAGTDVAQTERPTREDAA